MAVRIPSLPIEPWRASLAVLPGRLGRWWLREFLDLFPDRVARWLAGSGRKVLLLGPGRDAVSLELVSDDRRQPAPQRISAADYSASSIEHFLKSHGLQRNDVVIGIRLPMRLFFGRSLFLPAATAPVLADVVRQDLVTKTPFRADDIHHDYTTSSTGKADKILVRQWVIRRELVNNAVASLGIDLESVAFIDAASDHDQDSPAPIITLRRDGGRKSLLRRIALALGAGTLLLAVMVGGLKHWRQQTAMDDLGAAVAAAKARAQQVRSAIDKLDQRQAALLHLRSRKAQTPSVLDVWTELTQVLPAHSWLTELRLSEAPDKRLQVAMTGLSAAAASLVALVDQSALFAETALTAPIAPDPIEGRERFALQAKIKRPIQAKDTP